MARAARSPLECICGTQWLPHSKSSVPEAVRGLCHAAFALTGLDSCTQMCHEAKVGYQPHEPHGSSPVTTRTVVWSRLTAHGRGRVTQGRGYSRRWPERFSLVAYTPRSREA